MHDRPAWSLNRPMGEAADKLLPNHALLRRVEVLGLQPMDGEVSRR